MEARAPEGPCCRGRGQGHAITQAQSSIAGPERPSRYGPHPSGSQTTRPSVPTGPWWWGQLPRREEGQPLKSRERGQVGMGQARPKPYIQFLEKEGRQTLPLAHHIRRFWKTNPIPDSKASGIRPRGSRATRQTGPHEARGGAGALPPGQLPSTAPSLSRPSSQKASAISTGAAVTSGLPSTTGRSQSTRDAPNREDAFLGPAACGRRPQALHALRGPLSPDCPRPVKQGHQARTLSGWLEGTPQLSILQRQGEPVVTHLRPGLCSARGHLPTAQGPWDQNQTSAHLPPLLPRVRAEPLGTCRLWSPQGRRPPGVPATHGQAAGFSRLVQQAHRNRLPAPRQSVPLPGGAPEARDAPPCRHAPWLGALLTATHTIPPSHSVTDPAGAPAGT